MEDKKSKVFESIVKREWVPFVVKGWGVRVRRHVWRFWNNSNFQWPYMGWLQRWDILAKSQTWISSNTTDSLQALFPQLSNKNNYTQPLPNENGHGENKAAMCAKKKCFEKYTVLCRTLIFITCTILVIVIILDSILIIVSYHFK